jgi:glycosyltransferase 2 family protein
MHLYSWTELKDAALSLGKHWRIGLLGTLISGLAIYFIVSQIDLDLLAEALAAARFIYVLPCILLLIVGLVTRAIRWQLLLTGKLPLHRAFNIMNVSYLVNGILPLRAGEVARIYLAARARTPVPVFQCASTIVIERLLDLLAVVILVAIALTYGPVPEELRYAGAVAGTAGFGGFLALIYLSRRRELAQRMLAFFTTRFSVLERLNLANWLDQFLDGLQPLATARTLFLALFWTTISWGFSVLAGYVIMFTFFDNPTLAVTCLYIAAASLAIAVPAVPGSLGTFEVSILLALGAMGFGEPITVATAFAVTVHATNLAVYAAVGIAGFIQEGIALDQLSRGVRDIHKLEVSKHA